MMEFGQTVRYGFDHYFDFKGRCPRAAYWWWTLFALLVAGVSGLMDFALWDSGFLSSMVSILLFIPGLSLQVRRLHDSNLSGKIILLPYLFILLGGMFLILYEVKFLAILAFLIAAAVGIYIFIRCGFFVTDPQENIYGAPLDISQA